MVFGVAVPKSLALRNPERTALRCTHPQTLSAVGDANSSHHNGAGSAIRAYNWRAHSTGGSFCHAGGDEDAGERGREEE